MYTMDHKYERNLHVVHPGVKTNDLGALFSYWRILTVVLTCDTFRAAASEIDTGDTFG